jgi:hypothetical protein
MSNIHNRPTDTPSQRPLRTGTPVPEGPADRETGLPTAASVERQFKDAEIRARRHWYADGVAEIVVGAAFLAVACYFALQAAVVARGAAGGPAKTLVNILLPVLVFVAVAAARSLVRRVKERLVYPRAGYVAFADVRGPRWLPGLVGAAVGALTVVLLRRAPGLETWLPAFQGFLVGGALASLARTSGLPRLLVPGLLVMLCGIAVSLLRLPAAVSWALVFAASGAIICASGSLALGGFLREAPPKEAE